MAGVGNILLILAFVLLIVATFVARLELIPRNPEPDVESHFKAGAVRTKKLFVFIPGLDRGRAWPDMRAKLRPHGDTIMLRYPHPLLSNARPERVATRLADAAQRRFETSAYSEVVLIGGSLGALLAKRAFLEGEASGHGWSKAVSRVVLVAGMNRGWDISGQKPSDMGLYRRATIWAGTWVGRLFGFGGLVLSTEAGSPFVANVRADWLQRMRKGRPIEVVQLLGDIDDLVSEEDNKDLQAVSNRDFAWVKVRGTGHGNIVDFKDQTRAGDLKLGDYRRQKFVLAATRPFDEVKLQNEVAPFQPDADVTHLVFVVHGIRDLGEWAAGFEQELRRQFRAGQPKGSTAKIAVASIRYGYFGMGPFLLRPIRQRYVKWFMDEYTEALARYPNVDEVHFVGHSNGTYLLAAALEKYDSLRVERVVFGGSVVRCGYDWQKRLEKRPDLDVRNYMAIDDWVVALFPRFFEVAPVDGLLDNDIGSAGFDGFDLKTAKTRARVKNITGLTGGHAAFMQRMQEITDFVLNGASAAAAKPGPGKADSWGGAFLAGLSKWGAAWGTWLVVWPLLALIVLFVGWHVTTAGSPPRWPWALAYAVLVLLILRKV